MSRYEAAQEAEATEDPLEKTSRVISRETHSVGGEGGGSINIETT